MMSYVASFYENKFGERIWHQLRSPFRTACGKMVEEGALAVPETEIVNCINCLGATGIAVRTSSVSSRLETHGLRSPGEQDRRERLILSVIEPKCAMKISEVYAEFTASCVCQPKWLVGRARFAQIIRAMETRGLVIRQVRSFGRRGRMNVLCRGPMAE